MNPNDSLKKAAEALQRAVDEKNRKKLEEDRKFIVAGVGKDLVEAIKPALEKIATDNGKLALQAIKEMKEAKMPDVVIPDVHVPTPQVEVNVDLSSIKVPQSQVSVSPIVKPVIDFPKEMDIKGWVSLMGVDLQHPLPVQIRDANGKPVQFGGGTAFVGGGGGGKHDYFTIKGFEQSAYAELMNADGRLKVSMESGSSGLTDTELRASSVPVAQASGAIWSTAVIDIFGSTAASGVFNGDNRIKVSVETGGSGLTDSELRAAHLDVQQVSGSIDSVNIVSSITLETRQVSGAIDSVVVTEIFGSTAASVVNPDGRLKVELPTGSSGLTDTELRATSVPVSQVSGANWSVNVATQDFTLDVKQVSGSIDSVSVTNTVTVSATDLDTRDLVNTTDSVRTYQLSGASWSVEASLVSGTTVNVNGATNSTISVGPTLHDAVDVGSAPQKVGGVAVTTANPTAVTGGDVSNFRTDDLGRQLVRPFQVRDLTLTAYVTVTTGIETTLLAASAGNLHDLVYVMASNESSAAQNIDIRAVTGGNVVMSLAIPANSTAGVALPMPFPQDATGNNWTVDNDGTDVSNTTINVSALFVREI